MRKIVPSFLSTSPLLGPLSGLSVCAAAVAVAGCGSSPTPPIDATFPDAAIVFPDGGNLADPCDAPMQVTGTVGMPTEVMLDTTMTDTRPRDLGLACGNVTARRWSRQEVIEYTVPGTGPMGVTISTANMGTDATFNTVIQLRSECRVAPAEPFPPSCFDDAGTETQAEGGLQAMGGDTVFIYVTGHSEPEAVSGQVDEGRVRVTITASPNSAPTLTSGRMRLIMNDSRIEAQGTDADGNILGVTVGLLNAAGRLDFNGDGVGNDLDVFDLRFTETTGTTDWTGRVDISGMVLRFAEVCRDPMVRCTQAVLIAYDTAFATSAAVRVPVADAAVVGIGATCNEENVCGPGLVCGATTMICELTPELAAACTGATVLMVPPPAGTATSVSQSFTLAAGSTGLFTVPPACAASMSGDPSAGPERVFRVDVPAGTYDLTVQTDRPGTSADTIVSVLATCGDPASLGCQDDISMGVTASRVTAMNVTEGDYYAVVESYGGEGGAVELQATLRPVLASGAMCDPAGVQNRCATGACAAATMLCP